MVDRLPNETDKAWQAFQDFLKLGPARSLAVLHKQYKRKNQEKSRPCPTRSYETLQGWSHKFNWFARAGEWDAKEEERRREYLREKQQKEWERQVKNFQEQNQRIADATTRIVIQLLGEASKSLAWDGQGKKPILTPDQAIRAIAAVAKAGEFAQSTQGTALGVAQLLEKLKEMDGDG